MEFFMEMLSCSPWPMNFSRRTLKYHLVLLFQFRCAFYRIFDRFFWCLFLFFLRIFFFLLWVEIYLLVLLPISPSYMVQKQRPDGPSTIHHVLKATNLEVILDFSSFVLLSSFPHWFSPKVLSPKHTFDLSTSIFTATRW